MVDSPLSGPKGLTPRAVATLLAEAKNQPESAVSAAFMLDRLGDRSAFSLNRRHFEPTKDRHGSASGGEWGPPPIPTGASISPIPLEFELPMGYGTAAPITQLAHWWDQIKLFDGPPAPTTSWLTGDRLIIGARDGDGWEYSNTRSLYNDAQMRIYDDHVEFQGIWSLTTARIQQPGFVAGLIPGYGEIRELASLLSRQTVGGTMGCKVAHSWISAITLEMTYSRGTVLRPKAAREKSRRLGYGPFIGYTVGIEANDGWRPFRLCISEERSKVAEDDVVGIVNRLLRLIVKERQHRDQDPVTALQLRSLTLSSDFKGSDVPILEHRRSARTEIPGAVLLTSPSMEGCI